MPAKQASKMWFFVLVLLSSMNKISYSLPESNQEIVPSQGNLSLPPIDDAPVSELEDQSLSPDQYADDTAPVHVEEPDFFAPELYSPSPSVEALATKTEANGHISQIQTPSAAPPDFTLLERTKASAKPEAINVPEIEAAGAPALSTGSLLREIKAVSAGSKSQANPPATAPSTAFTSPETKAVSANIDDNKTPATAPSVAIQLPEMHAASPAPLRSNLPNNYTAEDAYNTTTTETTPPKADMESSQEASSSGVDIDDDGVDMPPTINNPSAVIPSNYSAEDETVDIVYEEDRDGSWNNEQNNLVSGGVIVGVCFILLAGLVCKNKKKTELQYQSLYKGA